ncbi:MAG: hypothetical protein R2729_31455 [Bryobacteraceae bacterium]
MQPLAPILGLAALAGLLVGSLGLIVMRSRRGPNERERRRRRNVFRMGRMGDGICTDVQGDIVYYSYRLQGVDYNTSQDVSALRNLVPADGSLIIGPVTFKYLVREPGNSIVVCEDWSGLRIRSRTIVEKESFI